MKTFQFKPITYYRVAMWLFVALTMFAIFMFSAQDGTQSAQMSDKIVNVIENQLSTPPTDISNTSSDSLAPPQEIKLLTFFVRKSAHILIFASLGFFLYGAICTYKGSMLKHILFSFAIGIVYAASDELHQYFINGRNASFSDVLIDSLGVVIGIVIMFLVVLIFKRIKNNKALGF